MKTYLKKSLWPFFSWVAAAIAVGLVTGFIGSGFHMVLDWAGEMRQEYGWLLWLLPMGGVAIALLYEKFGRGQDHGTDGVIDAIITGNPMSWRTTPMILLATTATHLLGGSAGREGAALQLGGSLGAIVSRPFAKTKASGRVFAMCGAAGSFAAFLVHPLQLRSLFWSLPPWGACAMARWCPV